MNDFNPGIVICSRYHSSRIPGKIFKPINGISVFGHLLRQLKPINVPVIVAVPTDDANLYMDKFHFVEYGCDHDPLMRTLTVANKYGLTHVVRITHDKIFIDTNALKNALDIVRSEPEIDYLHSEWFTPGTGFEIISIRCLRQSAMQFKNVEHLTYAARACAQNIRSAPLGQDTTTFNLLIDFPEDLKLMEVIFSALGNDCTLPDVIKYLKQNPKLAYINSPPKVTVYTCAYNAGDFIQRAMKSIEQQKDFKWEMEYIIVDDCSTDNTLEQIAKFAVGKSNVKWYRNQTNIGLASSSNFALSRARGKYIVRLDADDFFTDPFALSRMALWANNKKLEAVYPAHHFGTVTNVVKGNHNHHVGGTLFDRNALNFIRFTDGIRNHDSLDLFVRAKDKLKIGYYERPLFMYTQRDGSMSRTNIAERNKLAVEIIKNGGARV